MGWSIKPSNSTATINEETGAVHVNPNSNASSIDYTVRYEEDGYCGEYTFTQEGSGGGGTCDPCKDCLGGIYVNFKLKNNTGNSLTLYPSVKLKAWRINPDDGNCNFLGQFDYAEPKQGGSYRSLTIPAGGEATLTHDNLTYVGESSIVKACGEHWRCTGEEASSMNGQEIFETTVYLYAGGSINCTISPSTFNAGSQGDIKDYTVTIQ